MKSHVFTRLFRFAGLLPAAGSASLRSSLIYRRARLYLRLLKQPCAANGMKLN